MLGESDPFEVYPFAHKDEKPQESSDSCFSLSQVAANCRPQTDLRDIDAFALRK